jgi:RND family efflux transporter MFP subunit
MNIRLFIFLGLTAAARAQDWHDGLCQATVDASLSFPVGGVLAKVLVREGESVKAGEPLLELENDIETLEVKRQELAVEAARKDYDRTKNAFSRGGSITQEELDQKEAVWKISLVEKQQAEAQLKRKQLLSPTDGVVMDLFDFDRGEAVAPNTPAVRVVNTAECRFTSYVKGDTKHGCEKGKPVEVVLFTGAGEVTMTGTIEFVAAAIDAGSGLQEVRAVFANPDGKIAAGLKGKMRLKAAP